MKGKILENFNSNINDYSYNKGQIIEVTELYSFHLSYAIYRYDTVDWIPKNLVQIIE